MGGIGGPTVERVSAFNGDGGLGRHPEPRRHGRRDADGDPRARRPGGPGGPGGPLTEEQINEQRVRRMKMELQRWTVALFADSNQPFTDAGVAESPDGKADILETRDEAGPRRAPLHRSGDAPAADGAVQEIRPRIMMTGGPGGPGGGGGRRSRWRLAPRPGAPAAAGCCARPRLPPVRCGTRPAAGRSADGRRPDGQRSPKSRCAPDRGDAQAGAPAAVARSRCTSATTRRWTASCCPTRSTSPSTASPTRSGRSRSSRSTRR